MIHYKFFSRQRLRLVTGVVGLLLLGGSSFAWAQEGVDEISAVEVEGNNIVSTATILTKALNDHGVHAVMIGTGQTGLIQGARYGIPLDAVPSQFCAGELESTIVEAFEGMSPRDLESLHRLLGKVKQQQLELNRRLDAEDPT